MLLADPQFARSDVLRVFNHSQIYLLLGAAITTVGLLAAAFSLLRRSFDRLLFWFALFAILYGLRLCMNYQLLWALGLRPAGFQRIVVAIGFLVPIPALFFFERLSALGKNLRILALSCSPIFVSLAILTLIFGPADIFYKINNVVVISALVILVVALVRIGTGPPDIALIRRGLFCFILGAIYDNVTEIFGRFNDVEPFGFVILIAALGIVVGRRTLAHEQQLTIIQKELEIAKRIQLSILPSSLPISGSFRVTARYLPMTSVAGDFYDVLVTSDNKAGLLIADVSGHGVPAALIASMVKVAAATQLANVENPSALLLGMNATLCGNTQNQFATAAYVYLDAASEELRYSAAAHPPMLLVRNGTITALTENGLMLAAFPLATYNTVTQCIESGDRFVLYTDGLLEAMDSHEEEFGGERLKALVRETATLPQDEAADRIIFSVQQWALTQSDDLTLLLCDYIASV